MSLFTCGVLLSASSHGQSRPCLSSLVSVCVLIHKPCGCCGDDVTPISITLCLRLLRALTGQGLVAVFTETEDGQHVSPLLPPQGVSLVQRGQLAERGERGWMSNTQSAPKHSSCLSTHELSLLGCHFIHHRHPCPLSFCSASAYYMLLGYMSGNIVIYLVNTLYCKLSLSLIEYINSIAETMTFHDGLQQHWSDKNPALSITLLEVLFVPAESLQTIDT